METQQQIQKRISIKKRLGRYWTLHAHCCLDMAYNFHKGEVLHLFSLTYQNNLMQKLCCYSVE